MRIKGFKIGKSKEKPEEDVEAVKDNTAEQIVETEDKIDDGTKDLEETAQELPELSDETENVEDGEETPVGPHPPLEELTVESEDDHYDDEDILAEPNKPIDELSIVPEDKLIELDDDKPEADLLEEGAGEIQVVEMKVGGEPGAEEESEGEPKVDDIGGDSMNNLFSDEEEEENPLANLIKALPDVTAQELVGDLDEIQGIIKEWQKS